MHSGPCGCARLPVRTGEARSRLTVGSSLSTHNVAVREAVMAGRPRDLSTCSCWGVSVYESKGGGPEETCQLVLHPVLDHEGPFNSRRGRDI